MADKAALFAALKRAAPQQPPPLNPNTTPSCLLLAAFSSTPITRKLPLFLQLPPLVPWSTSHVVTYLSVFATVSHVPFLTKSFWLAFHPDPRSHVSPVTIDGRPEDCHVFHNMGDVQKPPPRCPRRYWQEGNAPPSRGDGEVPRSSHAGQLANLHCVSLPPTHGRLNKVISAVSPVPKPTQTRVVFALKSVVGRLGRTQLTSPAAKRRLSAHSIDADIVSGPGGTVHGRGSAFAPGSTSTPTLLAPIHDPVKRPLFLGSGGVKYQAGGDTRRELSDWTSSPILSQSFPAKVSKVSKGLHRFGAEAWEGYSASRDRRWAQLVGVGCPDAGAAGTLGGTGRLGAGEEKDIGERKEPVPAKL
ncbi:hypothetical protein BDK51DRAFT_50602 [Blyttiomyces helicus]|uniref:Uncharacterized protein n=1 Tax=Blyttiomyces helicus TaxID=388810 RepID=A0A4P9W596_9FUNG|nr:hypothetical protein BDK51DRAFT_50602 [Blyttiomyces helicus]|eukprot:RKO85276.1 hypothetical protein BDK51DRAFT_50602 [Blyttiomyces helicus]